MDIPRFCREHVNPRLGHKDLGDAFPTFVLELLLPAYPDLHLFAGGGKDGAIDLSQTVEASRTVLECKHIGKDGLGEAQKQWRNVAKKLKTHLVDPSGPTRYQAQYGPWYRTDPAIREYLFCISSRLSNQDQIDQLRQEIADFFTALGAKHAHLAHLTGLSVTVLHWDDLWLRVQQRPHLIFRWFPVTRPHGLVPLGDSPQEGTFRSYLTSDRLPYYSRGRHLTVAPAPPGVEIPDEEGLLRQLDDGDARGLIVTGSGGVGKTRLMLEIGRLAQRRGWLVLRTQSRLREDALEGLAERIAPETSVLLLVDYIETQRDFGELVETLDDLNDTHHLRLRYVANCRTSYYPTVAAISRHKQVDLSPIVSDSALSWLQAYRQRAVRHILEESGLQVTDTHLSVCHDVPIIAVFISYLHSTGRQPELAGLLKEGEFGTWVAKRVQLSFGQTVIHRDLALLVALLPIPAAVIPHLDQQKHGALLDTLATDGWIEKRHRDEADGNQEWVAAHDVLADQIVLSHFRNIPRTVDRFVDELLSLACNVGCLRSALLALQRLVDQPLLSSVDWPRILAERMASNPAAWREVRDVLIRTSLLTPLHRITLLGGHEGVWEDAEEETDFQNALGWLARWAVSQGEQGMDGERRAILDSWVQKAAPHAVRSNFVLTCGIRLCPETVRDAALEWILTRPLLFQTHYLLVAWLECGLPVGDIASSVRQWAAKFCRRPHLSFVVWAWLEAGGEKELVRGPIEAWLPQHQTDTEASFVYRGWLEADGDKELVRGSIEAWLPQHQTDAEAGFVYRAWLDAHGEKELVHGPIEAWLPQHQTDAEAGFVYRAWLEADGDKELVRDHMVAWLGQHATDAGSDFVYKGWLEADGDKELVREHMVAWLGEHGTDAEADFVYKAWLEADGEFSVIRSPATLWLRQNCEKAEAVYVTKFLAKQLDIPIETVGDILTWCQRFPADKDALWRLTQLGRHLLREEIADEACSTSETVLSPLISHDVHPTTVARGQIATLLCYLISAAGLHLGQLRNRVDALLLMWLRNPTSFGDDPKPHINLQLPHHVQRVVDLVVSGALSVTADREPLERFLRWVDSWEPERKSQLYRTFDFLKRSYPAPRLWDMVRFTSEE